MSTSPARPSREPSNARAESYAPENTPEGLSTPTAPSVGRTARELLSLLTDVDAWFVTHGAELLADLHRTDGKNSGWRDTLDVLHEELEERFADLAAALLTSRTPLADVHHIERVLEARSRLDIAFLGTTPLGIALPWFASPWALRAATHQVRSTPVGD